MDYLTKKFRLVFARLGLWFLKRSGVFNGFYDDWRWAVFDRAEDEGIHLLPVHYYSPVPAQAEMVFDESTPLYHTEDDKTLDEALESLSALTNTFSAKFSEISSRPPYKEANDVQEFRFGIAPYSTVEAELLYGTIRTTKPSRIVEIGCGHTTLLTAEAIRDEPNYSPVFECIEPYRPTYLKSLPTEVTAFHDIGLQDFPLEQFESLKPGDILFIDSSHVAKYRSDVVYEILNILPVLQRGVRVHFHDIFLPYEYPTDWLANAKFFWNEQYVLSALVRDNPRYKVTHPLHQLYRQRRADVERLFPLVSQSGHGPGAYWIEIASDPSV